MKSFLLFLLLSWGVVQPTASEPPCQCEIQVLKRRKSLLPCIVGLYTDAASGQQLVLTAMIVNNCVFDSNDAGETYAEVLGGRHVIEARCYAYGFCKQKITIQQGDSLVCHFKLTELQEELH